MVLKKKKTPLMTVFTSAGKGGGTDRQTLAHMQDERGLQGNK